MAKTFTNLKSTGLGLTDKITFGKYKNCRVCDILDDWEYLTWLKRNTDIRFQTDVLQAITAKQAAWKNETHYIEEVAPYIDAYGDEDLTFKDY